MDLDLKKFLDEDLANTSASESSSNNSCICVVPDNDTLDTCTSYLFSSFAGINSDSGLKALLSNNRQIEEVSKNSRCSDRSGEFNDSNSKIVEFSIFANKK